MIWSHKISKQLSLKNTFLRTNFQIKYENDTQCKKLDFGQHNASYICTLHSLGLLWELGESLHRVHVGRGAHHTGRPDDRQPVGGHLVCVFVHCNSEVNCCYILDNCIAWNLKWEILNFLNDRKKTKRL